MMMISLRWKPTSFESPRLRTLRLHAHVIYCKNDNFLMKKCDIFLIFAQNIDRGYTLEPPQ